MNICDKINQLPIGAQEIIKLYWHVSGQDSGTGAATVFIYAEEYLKENYQIDFRQLMKEQEEYDIT